MTQEHIQSPRKLPPLEELRPSYAGLATGHTQIHALLTELRQIAQHCRSRKAQQFYTTREIAAFFKVDQKVAVRVFATLENEGLLIRFRGRTGTLLQPRRRQPRTPVHGVVGIPVWQWGYCELSDWRVFITRLEEHLRGRNFVGDIVFFDQTENPSSHDFAERLLSHHLDWIIWFKPLPTYTQTIRLLRDGSVSVGVIADEGIVLPFPGYQLSYSHAIQRCFRQWARAGLRNAIIATSNAKTTALTSWQELLRQARISVDVAELREPQELHALLTKLRSHSDQGIIFTEPALTAHLANRSGNELLALLRSHRTLLMHRIELDPKELSGVTTDFIIPNWDKLAAQIAEDIATGQLLRQTGKFVFEAELHLRANAAKFSQAY